MKTTGHLARLLGFVAVVVVVMAGLYLFNAFERFLPSYATLKEADEGLKTPAQVPEPYSSFFSSLPVHLVGERVETEGYGITLSKVTLKQDRLTLRLTLDNASEKPIDLRWAVQLYDARSNRLSSEPIKAASLPVSSTIEQDWTYLLPAPPAGSEALANYRLLYAPFGWSGPVILFRLTDTSSAPTVARPAPAPSAGYGPTGDPWKMLVLVYKNIDTGYVDTDGIPKRLTATMPEQDIAAMESDFLNQPHRNVVYDYSDQTAELEAHIVEVARPLTDLEPIGSGYWPSPDVTRPELDAYAPKGEYDSVIVFWQASNPTTGQSIPIYGWGLGYWPGDYANGMTYATVFNISWVWPSDPCHGEVFLHEWLHGVTGFYSWRGFPFPYEDLHGAEEAGYVPDANGCWEPWLRDYMRGLVYENGQRTALVPETWTGGSITTYDIQDWRGEYYNDETPGGIPVVIRDDPQIGFEWQSDSPHPLISPDHFSVRWTKNRYFSSAGTYRFDVFRDDGARLWVDDTLIVDRWEGGREWIGVDQYLPAGHHMVRLETYDIDGWASATLKISLTVPHTISPPNTPTGPVIGNAGQSLTYTTGGAVDSRGHTVQYRFDWGDGNYSPWSFYNSVSHAWAAAGTYVLRAEARCPMDNSAVSDWSWSKTVIVRPPHAVSTPGTPSGPPSGYVRQTLAFATTGSTDTRDDGVQYRFSWGDGTFSGWSSSTSASHVWPGAGSYQVRVQARCSSNTSLVSAWSGIFYVAVGYPPAPHMEWGSVPVDSNWQTVPLGRSYTNPVVVAKPPTGNSSDPVVVRITHVTSTSFDIQLQEWDYLDGDHPQETVDYLVVEAGDWMLADGTQIEAGKVEADITSLAGSRLVSFSVAFTSAPVVISSVGTNNETEAVTTRNKNVNKTGFRVSMQEQELNYPSHATETVYYVAWQQKSGMMDGTEYRAGRLTGVTNQWKTLGVSPNDYFVLADMQTRVDIDRASVRRRVSGTGLVQLRIEEERSKDLEVTHGQETVGYIVIHK